MHFYIVLLLFEISNILSVNSQSIGRYRNRHLMARNNCPYNICEHVSNYPEDLIKDTVKENTAFHTYFGDVVGPTKDISISNRDGTGNYEPFCRTIEVTKIPRFMKDIDLVERVVVNVDGYSQVVKFQTCSFSNGGECYAGRLLERKTKCAQKFNVIKLVTLNMSNHVLEYRKFQIPTACVCTYIEE